MRMNCKLPGLSRLLIHLKRSVRTDGHQGGFTAIEISVALLIISFLSLFVLNVMVYSSKIQLEKDQYDFALQRAREVLEQLKATPDWREVGEKLEPEKAWNTDFTFQMLPSEGPEEGLTDLELTIGWVGPQGMEQLVFTTSVLDSKGDL
ncbi:MAG: hypothetical protein GHCLOJNM_01096 [bacterium]|nr:hypothetical protein [bacterium]